MDWFLIFFVCLELFGMTVEYESKLWCVEIKHEGTECWAGNGGHWVEILLIFMCMGVLSACVSVYYMHDMQYPWRRDENVRTLGTRVRGNCELSCGCWGPNPGLLEEQPALFNLWGFAAAQDIGLKNKWRKLPFGLKQRCILDIPPYPWSWFPLSLISHPPHCPVSPGTLLKIHSLLICLIWCVRLMMTLYLDAWFSLWYSSQRKQLSLGSHYILCLEKCSGNFSCILGKDLLLKGESRHSLASSLG